MSQQLFKNPEYVVRSSVPLNRTKVDLAAAIKPNLNKYQMGKPTNFNFQNIQNIQDKFYASQRQFSNKESQLGVRSSSQMNLAPLIQDETLGNYLVESTHKKYQKLEKNYSLKKYGIRTGYKSNWYAAKDETQNARSRQSNELSKTQILLRGNHNFGIGF